MRVAKAKKGDASVQQMRSFQKITSGETYRLLLHPVRRRQGGPRHGDGA
jgi:hypothetical protein